MAGRFQEINAICMANRIRIVPMALSNQCPALSMVPRTLGLPMSLDRNANQRKVAQAR